MTKGYFITGTDTGVGKTLISLAIMQYFQHQGLIVNAMKPVASGCIKTLYGLRNDDALQLQKQSSTQLEYDIVNPYAFEPAIAPHIAAQQIGTSINIDVVKKNYLKIVEHSDVVIVEGAGGLLVPINQSLSMLDIAIELDLEVIVVVGIRLGCINHALLTLHTITQSKLKFAGWIANQIESDVLHANEVIAEIKLRITAPLLGSVPFQNEPSPQCISRLISFE